MERQLPLIEKLSTAKSRSRRSWCTAISPIIAGITCCFTLVGCKSDNSSEALRQENAALRREAANRDATYGPTSAPLSDSVAHGGPLPAAPGAAIKPGSVPVNAPLSEADMRDAMSLGLPVYPGATLNHVPGTPDNSVLTGGGVNIVLLQCSDKLDAVVAFYTEKMAVSNADPKLHGVKRPPSRTDRLQDKSREVMLTDVQPGGGMRSVKVREDGGKTYIELMNITGKQIPASVMPGGKPLSGGGGASAETGPPTPTSTGTTGSVGASGANGSAGSSGPIRSGGSGGSNGSGAPRPQTGSSSSNSSGQLPDNDPLKPPLLLPRGN